MRHENPEMMQGLHEESMSQKYSHPSEGPLGIQTQNENKPEKEVDAYLNPTELFKWLNIGNFEMALGRAVLFEDEVSTWILSKVSPNETIVRWRYLPLHLACLHPEPSKKLIGVLLNIYPKATTCRDSSGNLPIHYICSNSNLDIAKMLISCNPKTSTKKDGKGRTLREICQQNDSNESKYLVEWLDSYMVKNIYPSLKSSGNSAKSYEHRNPSESHYQRLDLSMPKQNKFGKSNSDYKLEKARKDFSPQKAHVTHRFQDSSKKEGVKIQPEGAVPEDALMQRISHLEYILRERMKGTDSLQEKSPIEARRIQELHGNKQMKESQEAMFQRISHLETMLDKGMEERDSFRERALTEAQDNKVLRENIKKLELEISTLTTDTSELRNIKEQLHQRLKDSEERAEQETRELRSKLQSMQMKVEGDKFTITSLQDSLHKAENNLTNMTAESQLKDTQMEKLASHFSSLKAKSFQNDEALDHVQKFITDLQRKLSAQNAKSEILEERLRRSEKEKEMYVQQIELQDTEFESRLNEIKEEIKNNSISFGSIINSVSNKNTISLGEDKFNDLQSLNSLSSPQGEGWNRRQRYFTELEDEIVESKAKHEKEVLELKSRIISLEAELKVNCQSISKANEERAINSDKCLDLEKRNFILQQKNEKLLDENIVLIELKEKIKSLELTNESLSEDILRKKSSDEKSSDMIESLRKQNSQLEFTQNHLQKSLTEAELKIKQMQVTIDELDTKLKNSRNTETSVSAELLDRQQILQSELQSIFSHLRNFDQSSNYSKSLGLDSQDSSMNDLIERLTKDNIGHQESINLIKSKLQKMKNMPSFNLEKHISMKKQVGLLQKGIVTMTKNEKNTSDKMNGMDSLKQENQKLQDELKKLRDDSTEKQNGTKISEISTRDSILSDKEKELDQLRKKYLTLQEKNKNLSSIIKKNNASYVEKVSQMKNENRMLKSQYRIASHESQKDAISANTPEKI